MIVARTVAYFLAKLDVQWSLTLHNVVAFQVIEHPSVFMLLHSSQLLHRHFLITNLVVPVCRDLLVGELLLELVLFCHFGGVYLVLKHVLVAGTDLCLLNSLLLKHLLCSEVSLLFSMARLLLVDICFIHKDTVINQR